MIDRDHGLPLVAQAQQLGISRGSIYYLPRPASPADLTIMRRIDQLHLLYPFAGSRMLRDLLRQEDIAVGRRTLDGEAGRTIQQPEGEGCGDRFHVVLEGTLKLGETVLPRLSAIWLGEGEAWPSPCAGDEGVRLVVLQFPRAKDC